MIVGEGRRRRPVSDPCSAGSGASSTPWSGVPSASLRLTSLRRKCSMTYIVSQVTSETAMTRATLDRPKADPRQPWGRRRCGQSSKPNTASSPKPVLRLAGGALPAIGDARRPGEGACSQCRPRNVAPHDRPPQSHARDGLRAPPAQATQSWPESGRHCRGRRQEGDRVRTGRRGPWHGEHSSFAAFAPAQVGRLALKPVALSFEQAAAVPVSGLTALQGVRDGAEVQAGQSVLIIGASGGVGTFAVQIAKAYSGAEVTGVCSTGKTELVRSLGADHVVDYGLDDFADGDPRYDVILDIGGNSRLSHLRRALSANGRLVIVGGETGGRPALGRVRPTAPGESCCPLW